jgi:hypothetical protein
MSIIMTSTGAAGASSATNTTATIVIYLPTTRKNATVVATTH